MTLDADADSGRYTQGVPILHGKDCSNPTHDHLEEHQCGRPLGDWVEPFLDAYQMRGGVYLTASEVGITAAAVYLHASRDPVFAARFQAAREMHADRCERNLFEGKINPIGQIVLLKKYRPAEYLEKHMVTTLSVSVDGVADPALAREVLARMLGNASPETLAQLPAGEGGQKADSIVEGVSYQVLP